MPSICEHVACGNGVAQWMGSELCDDNNTEPGDGCDAACSVEAGWACMGSGGPCVPNECGDGVATNGEWQFGEGEFPEGCDDGNDIDGDGCSAACVNEPGWLCLDGMPCAPFRCGDGIMHEDLDEECDDGNTEGGDGCSASCTLEPGYFCEEETCVAAVCGDGVRDVIEACDDGNTRSGDGCDDGCLVESEYFCDREGGEPCRPVRCGDGFTDIASSLGAGGFAGTEDAVEGCDDGNLEPGDGCDPTCEPEQDGICIRSGNSTTECRRLFICGDGHADRVRVDDELHYEECDDGNRRSGDGCSGDCTFEEGWACAVGGSRTECMRAEDL